MASAALSRPQTTALPLADRLPGSEARPDDLCNDLLVHMLDCDLCLDPEQPECPVCTGLQSRIKAQGGATAGVLFAL
jgi:hypothetical protein